MLQMQLPPLLQPQGHQLKKPSKGVKGYPDGWQRVLNSAKDVVRETVLTKHPFPSSHLSRVTADECFHKALATECGANGLVLEPGTFSDHAVTSRSFFHKKGSRGPNQWFKS